MERRRAPRASAARRRGEPGREEHHGANPGHAAAPAQLRADGITLVAITNDPPGLLRQASAAYRLKGTPLVSDPNRSLTVRFGALGGGMHPDTANHTFILVDRSGIVRFHEDYPNMWAEPTQLLDTLRGLSG